MCELDHRRVTGIRNKSRRRVDVPQQTKPVAYAGTAAPLSWSRLRGALLNLINQTNEITTGINRFACSAQRCLHRHWCHYRA